MNKRRDFLGYGAHPPTIPWPNKARVALSFVLNFEEGSELSIADGDERNESVYEAKEEVIGQPDLCMESHYEYGTRAGYWRIMKLLEEFEAPVTVSACARAAKRSTTLIQDAFARGHEISCHGYRWESHARMLPSEEEAIIHSTFKIIQSITGAPPKGWHTRSASSLQTRQLLVEHGGFLYDSDAYNDDAPYFASGTARPHIILPYAFDTNDMRFQPGGGFVHHQDFSDYCIAAYDELWDEGAHHTKMLSIGLHLRIIGKAARIQGLRTFLKYVQQRQATWIARRDSIAMHWQKHACPTATATSV